MIFFLIFIVNLFSLEDFSIPPFAVISDTAIVNENSAILKSRKYPDVIWTLNDSGDSARIFAFSLNGKLIKPSYIKNYQGIKIYDAYNVDWEAMVYDSNGDILIIDSGNNYNYRRDLRIYKIREPNPYYSNEHGVVLKYLFEYPDQKNFPDEKNMDFDCEAAFTFKNKLCLITKTRTSINASIYCFDKLDSNTINIPKKMCEYNFGSMVTDASVSPDNKKLAVLTYNRIYVFDLVGIRNVYEIFKKKPYLVDISLGQCEGITFENSKSIIISNEEGYLFKILLDNLK